MRLWSLHISSILFILIIAISCSKDRAIASAEDATEVFPMGAYPQAVKDGDKYYYIMPDIRPGHMSIYTSACPDSLGKTAPVTVWETNNSNLQNIWSPELHKIGGKWYIYFEADNGNTDNHHIYVLENETSNPLSRQWELRGPIVVNDEWNYGIHPSTFAVGDRQYLIWSGWEKRRIDAETQCLFIAELENPWTLKSERVLISRPEYEWERQWINPDGSCSAYPIFVNENPEPYISPDGKRVIINYSASGIWTEYSSLGMLSASVSDDLLDPASWSKSEEPVFSASADPMFKSVSNISLIPSMDNNGTLMLYQYKNKSDSAPTTHSIMLKKIDWIDSYPVYNAH